MQRGESAGRQLKHDNVVCAFQTVSVISRGTVSFALPADFDTHNGAVVAYVQSQPTLGVRGATKVNFSN